MITGTTVTLTDAEAWELASRIRLLLQQKRKQANFCIFNRQGQLRLMVTMAEPRVATADIAWFKERQASLALLLGCVRKVAYKDRRIRQGSWNHKDEQPYYKIEGKVLGLSGYGAIGKKNAA